MPKTIRLNEPIFSCRKGIFHNDRSFSRGCFLLGCNDLRRLQLKLNGTLKKEASIALIPFETLDKKTIQSLSDSSYIIRKFGEKSTSTEGRDFVHKTYSMIMVEVSPMIRDVDIEKSVNIKLVGLPLCFSSIEMAGVISHEDGKPIELQTDIEIGDFYLPENNKNPHNEKIMASAIGYAVAKWIEERNNEMRNISRNTPPSIDVYPEKNENIDLVSFFLDGLNCKSMHLNPA